MKERMKKDNLSEGLALVGILIAIIIATLFSGGLYYYLSKQLSETPEISNETDNESIQSTNASSLPEEESKEEEPDVPEEEVTPPSAIETPCQNECSQSGLKQCSGNGYQTCSNYDTDSCLEWSSITACSTNTVCQNGNCIKQQCSDGTSYGQCSSTKPKYCNNGTLVDRCSQCGCPSSQTCDITSETCYTPIQTCPDGTQYGQCSTTEPLYCDQGTLINKCSSCGCSFGQQCQADGSCLAPQPTCQDECSRIDEKRCSESGYQLCGNYDTDSCFEWSSILNCPGISLCNNGECIKGSLRRPINIAVIEFEVKDQFEYGRAYYCCRTNPLSKEKECFFTNGQLNCDIVDESYSFLEVLNNPAGYFNLEMTGESPHSLFYINDYFEKEAVKYGYIYSQDIFNVTVLGPYKLDSDPPQRGRTTGSTQEIIDFFNNELAKRGINTSGYDSLAFIYLNDFQQNGGYQGFLSFANFPNIYISLDGTAYSAYNDDKLETFVHENAHNLGLFSGASLVTDSYIAPCPRGPYMSCCEIPDGIPDPDKEPLYPQNSACLMCGSIMLSGDGEGQATGNLDQVVICPETARELGWIK